MRYIKYDCSRNVYRLRIKFNHIKLVRTNFHKKLDFLQKILYLSIFRQKFESTIVIFEISTLEFSNMQSFMLKQKYLHLGQKLLYLGISRLEIETIILIFEINTLKFF